MNSNIFLSFLKNNFRKPKFWVYVTCFIFGLAIAFVLGLTIDSVDILGWVVLLIVGGILGLLVGGIMAFLYKFDWSGFRERKLWDWLQLLILPILVAVGGFLLSHQVDKREAKQTELRKQQETLRLYFDQMKTYTDRASVRKLLRKLVAIRGQVKFNDAQLIEIENIKNDAKPDLETVKSLTYTILEELDSEQKNQVFRYLYDIGLIRLEIPTKINKIGENEIRCTRSLKEVDISYVFESAIRLENANLENVDLSNRDLKRANFCRMKLNHANLSRADLASANLNEAELNEANLDWAIFSDTEFNYVGNIDRRYRLAMMVKKDSKVLQNLEKEMENDLKKDSKASEKLQQEENSKKIKSWFEKKFSNHKQLYNADLQKLDFSNADLSGFSLENSDLTDATLINADLSNTNLKGAKLDRAKLNGAIGLNSAIGLNEKLKLMVKILSQKKNSNSDFLNQGLRGKDLSNMNLDNLDLTNADLTYTNLEGASLKGSKLAGANLTGAKLENTILSGANLSGATLVKTSLINSNLEKANLEGARLTLADFRGSNLQNAKMHGVKGYAANFDEAKMQEVQLNSIDNKHRTYLHSCSMSQVNLSGADLSEADLIAVKLFNSIVKGVKMKRTDLSDARFISVDLRTVAEISGAVFEGVEYFDTYFPKFKHQKYDSKPLRKIPDRDIFSEVPDEKFISSLPNSKK